MDTNNPFCGCGEVRPPKPGPGCCEHVPPMPGPDFCVHVPPMPGCGCLTPIQPPQQIDHPHENCNCMEKEPEVIDLITPLYHACGGRLYRLLLATKAAAVYMGDGSTAELRIAQIERALANNTTLRFAANLEKRDEIQGLIPGDTCVVFDATADPTVHEGGATYMWMPGLYWKKMYNMDTPIDPSNFIQWGGGLAVDGDRLVYVDCPAIITPGGGLAVDKDNNIYVNAGDLFQGGGGLATDENGKWYVKLSDLIAWGKGIGLDSNGKLVIVPSDFFKPGGGLATDGEGKWYVNLGDLFKPGGGMSQGEDGKWQVNPWDFISPGSGLTVGGDGKLTFDSNSMDTTAFENLLKKLRLPKWLTGDMDLYVDGSSGSDVIVEGRGTRNLPFRTIGACVNNACENYNVSDYTLTIHVLSGSYTEQVNLKSYSRSGGRMRIVGEGSVNVSSGAAGSVFDASGGVWDLDNLRPTLNVSSQGGTPSCLAVSGGQTIVNIKNLSLATNKSGGSGRPIVINATDYGTVNIGSGCTLSSSGTGDGEALTAFGASIYLDCSSLRINGAYDTVARCYNRGSIIRQWDKMCSISGSASGRRFWVASGGIIGSQGGGENYFPGSSAGIVDDATYGVYE